MKLNDLTAVPGARKETKRIGRGIGSGQGKTAGKGSKGQKARSGGSIRPGFEGGQMPLQRRLPKRGFVNKFAKVYETVNVGLLEKFEDGAEVDAEALSKAGLADACNGGVKILGDGKLTKKLTVKANAFSASAKEKIEAVGGKTEVI
jgi:large subunit ribosomal protein L15